MFTRPFNRTMQVKIKMITIQLTVLLVFLFSVTVPRYRMYMCLVAMCTCAQSTHLHSLIPCRFTVNCNCELRKRVELFPLKYIYHPLKSRRRCLCRLSLIRKLQLRVSRVFPYLSVDTRYRPVS